MKTKLFLAFSLAASTTAYGVGPSYSPVPSSLSATGNWLSQGDVSFSGGKTAKRLTRVGGYYSQGFSVNRYSASGRVQIVWTGCIGASDVSYNNVGLAFPKPAWNGDLNNSSPWSGIQLAFVARWEDQRQLQIVRDQGASDGSTQEFIAIPTSNISRSQSGYCGKFDIAQTATKVTAKINDKVVYEGTTFRPNERVAAYARGFDNAITFNSLKVSVGLE